MFKWLEKAQVQQARSVRDIRVEQAALSGYDELGDIAKNKAVADKLRAQARRKSQ